MRGQAVGVPPLRTTRSGLRNHDRLRNQTVRRRSWRVQIPIVDVIHELLATRAAVEKLGARSISIEEAQQLLDNRYAILRDSGRRRSRGQVRARRLVTGRTDGDGR